MSASWYWKPVVPNDGTRATGLSSDRKTLEAVFGATPTTITQAKKDLLTAMHLATGRNESLYGDLADALDKHEEIEVWVEY